MLCQVATGFSSQPGWRLGKRGETWQLSQFFSLANFFTCQFFHLPIFSTCQYSQYSWSHQFTNNEQIGGAPVSYPEQWWTPKEEIPIVGWHSGWFNFVFVIVIPIIVIVIPIVGWHSSWFIFVMGLILALKCLTQMSKHEWLLKFCNCFVCKNFKPRYRWASEARTLIR